MQKSIGFPCFWFLCLSLLFCMPFSLSCSDKSCSLSVKVCLWFMLQMGWMHQDKNISYCITFEFCSFSMISSMILSIIPFFCIIIEFFTLEHFFEDAFFLLLLLSLCFEVFHIHILSHDCSSVRFIRFHASLL